MAKLLKFATSDHKIYYATSQSDAGNYFEKYKPQNFTAVFCGEENWNRRMYQLEKVGRGIYVIDKEVISNEII